MGIVPENLLNINLLNNLEGTGAEITITQTTTYNIKLPNDSVSNSIRYVSVKDVEDNNPDCEVRDPNTLRKKRSDKMLNL